MDMTTSPGQTVLSMGSQPVELWNTSLPCSPVIMGTLRTIQQFKREKKKKAQKGALASGRKGRRPAAPPSSHFLQD